MSAHEDEPVEVTWRAVSEASEETGVSVGAIRKWARRGLVASRTAEGPRGERLEVSLADVASRAEVLDVDRVRDSTAALPPDALPVPLDEWRRVLTQVGHLHEAGQALAEARERAAVAETREQFMREQVQAARDEAAALRARLAALEQQPPAPVPAAHVSRRWWSRART